VSAPPVADALVRRMFARIDAADWAGLADLLHPDVVYERPGYPPLAGRDRVLRFYREERAVSGRHDVQGTLGDGVAAAAWGRMRGRRRDGSPVDVRFAEVYELTGGRIRHRRSYFFTAAV
jgi:ketosteroid isomerase-like protein